MANVKIYKLSDVDYQFDVRANALMWCTGWRAAAFLQASDDWSFEGDDGKVELITELPEDLILALADTIQQLRTRAQKPFFETVQEREDRIKENAGSI